MNGIYSIQLNFFSALQISYWRHVSYCIIGLLYSMNSNISRQYCKTKVSFCVHRRQCHVHLARCELLLVYATRFYLIKFALCTSTSRKIVIESFRHWRRWYAREIWWSFFQGAPLSRMIAGGKWTRSAGLYASNASISMHAQSETLGIYTGHTNEIEVLCLFLVNSITLSLDFNAVREVDGGTYTSVDKTNENVATNRGLFSLSHVSRHISAWQARKRPRF